MEKLVNDSEKYLILEKRLMDKLLKAEEEGNLQLFSNISLFFCGLKDKTDKSVLNLMKMYPINTLANYLRAKFKYTEDTVCHLSLLEFIERRQINNSVEDTIKLDINSNCFLEEHIRSLYLLYVWYVNNHDLDENVKKALHDLMIIRLENSEFARCYFGGDISHAERVSSPDDQLGFIAANQLALSNYYDGLNKLIRDADASEMFEGVHKPFLVEAHNHILELELAALCVQMENRRIAYPFSDYPIGDYSRKILNNASIIYSDYSSKESRKKEKKSIYL